MPSPKLPILQRVLTRRDLLGAGAVGLGAAAFLPVASCGPPPPSPRPDGGPHGVAGAGPGGGNACSPDDNAGACSPTTCQADANTLVLAFADHPELVPVITSTSAQTGKGWGVYTDCRYSDPACGLDDIVVLHTAPSTYLALSASCTHACCTVGLSYDGTGLTCPCHGSLYDFTGVVQPGSAATHDLPTLSACSDACGVYVQLA